MYITLFCIIEDCFVIHKFQKKYNDNDDKQYSYIPTWRRVHEYLDMLTSQCNKKNKLKL